MGIHLHQGLVHLQRGTMSLMRALETEVWRRIELTLKEEQEK